MTQINLLPWREQLRQIKRMNFVIILGCFIVVTLFLVFISHMYLSGIIGNQQQLNAYLQSDFDKEQVELGALNKKKQEQKTVNTELHYILSLRENSYQAVRLLDELVKIVPDAVSLNKISRQGNSIILIGKAESNLQVTLFMENMAKSNFFRQPVLTEISSKENSAGEERYFQLKVELKDKSIDEKSKS